MRTLLTIVACIAVSEACTCFPFPALNDAFCYSGFVARVRATGRAEDTQNQLVRFSIVVIATFRNDFSNPLPTQLVTGSTSAACGLNLTVGVEYLIGGSIDGSGNLESGLCNLHEEWNTVSTADRAALQTFTC